MVVHVTITIDTIINGIKNAEVGEISTVVVSDCDYFVGVVELRVIFTKSIY